MKIYGMMYISDKSESVNYREKSASKMLGIYIANAQVLSKSLSRYGGITIITNSVSTIKKYAPELLCVEIDFKVNVPLGIRFRSAHHKIDVFEYFSTLKNQYSILMDLDVICFKDFESKALNTMKSNTPIFYDITKQVIPAYGESIVKKDMALLDPSISKFIWAGGEYISGDHRFFRDLSKSISNIWGIYEKECYKLHHQGDEMLVSVALTLLIDNGLKIKEAGELNLIGRYWSGRIKHNQLSLNYYLDNYSMIHFPQDKDIIARQLIWYNLNFLIFCILIRGKIRKLISFLKNFKII